jgi:hypothetical protein
MTHRITSVVTAIAALIALSHSAFADTETFSLAVPSAAAGSSSAFTLSGFDPSLGTLTGITVELTANSIPTVTAYNVGSSAGSFTNDFISYDLTLDGPDSSAAALIAAPVSYTVASGSLDPATSGFTSVSYSDFAHAISTSASIDPSAFSSYEVAAPVDFSLGIPTLNKGGMPSSPSIFAGGTGEFSDANVTVEYTYDAVPEPSSTSLIALAGAALAFARTVRRARHA